ncbi:beta-ketoacyl synthase chain length factor [Pseudomonadota bacterium]|uniref:beta-ketoacyl synthase chain length factor n=1 Tax=unclassified Shewanella TaxID=196818 RepID=UPI0026E1930B|nr:MULTISPECIES: beta-ketoacyl synthase chain length factor [unclassified Shewanella]MDO6618480.1 beta-ketoacyl synthase chain length factor [Shewanella sp. 6_MG-2023]MDO6640297.1 beta-ketoacyl synthase chain length factor [Shewanella sp. 5_MG-2023]
MQLVFDILSWGAWSQDFQDKESWSDEDKCAAESPPLPELAINTANLKTSTISPALPQVPAMQRRRFSRLTKMMLTAAYQCAPADNCRSVFASRHGELTRTLGLLQDIVIKEPLSPLAFSQSVHNTASGIYGIVTGNTAASTSIAAGEETLAQAMVEVFAQLAENPEPILMVFADDPVPPIYNQYTHEAELPLAMGLYLAPAQSSANKVAQLTLTSNQRLDPSADTISSIQLIKAIASGQGLSGQQCQYHWHLTSQSSQ